MAGQGYPPGSSFGGCLFKSLPALENALVWRKEESGSTPQKDCSQLSLPLEMSEHLGCSGVGGRGGLLLA